MARRILVLLIILSLPLLVMAQRVDIVNPEPSSSGNYTVLKSIGNTVTLGTAGSAGSVNMGAVTFRGSAAINAVGTTKMNSLAVFNSGGETTINKLTSTSTLSVGDDKASVSAGDETNARVSFNNIDPNTNVSIDAQNSTVYNGVFKVTGKTNAGTLKLDGKAFPNAGYGSISATTPEVDNLLGKDGNMKWEVYEGTTSAGVPQNFTILVMKLSSTPQTPPPNECDDSTGNGLSCKDTGGSWQWTGSKCDCSCPTGSVYYAFKCSYDCYQTGDYSCPQFYQTTKDTGGAQYFPRKPLLLIMDPVTGDKRGEKKSDACCVKVNCNMYYGGNVASFCVAQGYESANPTAYPNFDNPSAAGCCNCKVKAYSNGTCPIMNATVNGHGCCDCLYGTLTKSGGSWTCI